MSYLRTLALVALILMVPWASPAAADGVGKEGTIVISPDLLLGGEVEGSLPSLSAADDEPIDPDETDEERQERLRKKLGRLFLTLLSSPILAKIMLARISEVQDQKVGRWAREAYLMVDQAVDGAQRAGALTGPKLDKAQLFRQYFGEIVKNLPVKDSLVVGGSKNKLLLEKATRIANELHGGSYYGTVTSLRARASLSEEKASDLLKIQKEGALTSRELASKLLVETELRSSDILELTRHYDNKVGQGRAIGKRDVRLDAIILDAADPWRDPARSPFQGRLSRQTAAELLSFQGDAPSFEKKLVDSGVHEADRKIFAREFESHQKAEVERRSRIAAAPADGSPAPKRDFLSDRTGKMAVKAVPGGAVPGESLKALETHIEKIADRVNGHIPYEEYYVRALNTDVDILDSPKLEAKVTGKGIDVSSQLVQQVRAVGGDEGVAFLLGRHMAERTLKQAGITLGEPKLSFEIDRLGYRWAQRAYPDLDLKVVNRVMDAAAGRGTGLFGKVRRVTSAFADHTRPPEAERMVQLSKVQVPGAPASKGAVQRSAFRAPETIEDRLTPLKQSWTRGGPAAAVETLHRDFVKGGLLINVGIAAGMGLVSGIGSGKSLQESTGDTVRTLATPEFLVGNLLGGTLGAVAGSMLPIPAVLAASGAMGSFLSILPAMGLAIAGAHIGETVVSLVRRDQFSLKNLWNELPLFDIIAGGAGASLGVTIGSLVFPGPIGGMVGGLVGGWLASHALRALVGRPHAPGATVASTTVPSIHVTAPASKGAVAGDPAELREELTSSYESFVDAQRRGDVAGSKVHLARYGELRTRLDGLERQATGR